MFEQGNIEGVKKFMSGNRFNVEKKDSWGLGWSVIGDVVGSVGIVFGLGVV